MFYRPAEGHGLRHNPFNALVIPRPIGWISSLAADGTPNLAPFSFFNGVSYNPPQVMFSAGGREAAAGHKDSTRNIRETGEFVFNLATWELRDRMNQTSIEAPPDYDEFEAAGLTKAPSRIVKPFRVAESPVHFECKLVHSVDLPCDPGYAPNVVIFGEVVGFHIDESVITDGVVDYDKMDVIARLGGPSYCRLGDVFDMPRPVWTERETA